MRGWHKTMLLRVLAARQTERQQQKLLLMPTFLCVRFYEVLFDSSSNGTKENTVRVSFLRAFSGHHAGLQRGVFRFDKRAIERFKLALSDLFQNLTSLLFSGVVLIC